MYEMGGYFDGDVRESLLRGKIQIQQEKLRPAAAAEKEENKKSS